MMATSLNQSPTFEMNPAIQSARNAPLSLNSRTNDRTTLGFATGGSAPSPPAPGVALSSLPCPPAEGGAVGWPAPVVATSEYWTCVLAVSPCAMTATKHTKNETMDKPLQRPNVDRYLVRTQQVTSTVCKP